MILHSTLPRSGRPSLLPRFPASRSSAPVGPGGSEGTSRPPREPPRASPAVSRRPPPGPFGRHSSALVEKRSL